MKKNLVSVFIPSYNYARYLGAAIDSILAQTYTDWELIIVDDASTDDSPAIIERYQRRYPDKIRSLILDKNVGQSEATNIGYGMAKGEFVSPLAADDVATPQRLEEAVRYLNSHPKVAAVFSLAHFIDADSRPLPSGAGIFNQPFQDLRWRLLLGNFLCGTSAVMRLSALHEIGVATPNRSYNPHLGYVEDYDLWLRLLDHHEIARVDAYWVNYRVHGENLSYTKSKSEQKFGPLYESVAVAIRAMQRWPLHKLHTFQTKAGSPAYQKEVATVQSKLAETCLKLDEVFFGQLSEFSLTSPKLGLAAAYSFTLNALQNDPANSCALNLLSQIYELLGDTKRAAGDKSISLGEMHDAIKISADAPPEENITETAAQISVSPYENWVKLFNLNRLEAEQYDKLATSGGLNTRFHLATILPPGEEAHLVSTLQSLSAQSHANLLLTVVANIDAPPGFTGDRLRWIREDNNPLAAVNQSFIREDATWVGLIRCGDQLAESALTLAAESIQRQPQLKALYTDDDALENDGHLHSPRLKPDFDLALLRSYNYAEGLVLARWDTFASLSGFDTRMNLAANYDLLLKIAERDESSIGHLTGPWLHQLQPRFNNPEAQQQALVEHLQRQNIAANISAGPMAESVNIDYALSEPPLVSLIIPTRDRLPMLSRCIESLFDKTAYPAYEIVIIDHGSTSPDTQTFLQGLSSLGDARLKVIHYNGEYSLSALFNAGAKQAQGEYLLFMHDDVAALHSDWLHKIVAQAQQKGIGAVGPRLLTADGKLQHAGIALGVSGVAELIGNGASLDESGELGRLVITQAVAAASSACLLVNQRAFSAISGFDEQQFPLFYGDVDLCLRLAAAGWKTLYTPQATLLHDGPLHLKESLKSAPLNPAEKQQALQNETDALLAKWLPQLAADPCYNRLYSLHSPVYRVTDDNLLVRDLLPWKPLARILAQPGDRQACGFYRVSAPLLALAQKGLVQGWDTTEFYNPIEIERFSPDTVIFQRPYTDLQLDFIQQTQRHSQSLRVFELDDLITQIPSGNINRNNFPSDVEKRLKRAAAACDRVIVSTEALARQLKSWHEDIRVVPNYLPSDTWLGLQPQALNDTKPRIGWAGAYGHEGDLLLMESIFKELGDSVHWVVFGHCPTPLRPYVHELHEHTKISDYPAKLASLNLDLAIAPLEINSFNEAKSHLKILEYGILGYPVICTDISPYQGLYPVTRVNNQSKNWVKAIREHINDRQECRNKGEVLKAYVQEHWLLENNLNRWLQAWLR